MKTTIVLAALLAGAFGGSVFAAETTASDASKTSVMPYTAAANTATAATPMLHTTIPGERRMSRFVGASVYSAAGEKVGDVDDLLVDATGKVTGVVVGVGGFLGVGEKSVALGWNAVTVATDAAGKPRLVIDVTKDALEKAPAFESAAG